MARQQLKVVYPTADGGSAQRFSCQDCPARCCKTLHFVLSPAEAERIARDPEAVRRLTGTAPQLLAGGHLPMRLRGTELSCVFLDDDDRCSLHKRHGPGFLPAACQAYPFSFARNEHNTPLVLLSRHCPSINQNYGDPLQATVEEKLKLLGPGPQLSERMGLRSGRALPKQQYLRVVEAWRDELAQSANLAQSLARLFTLTEAVDQALPKSHHPSDRELEQALHLGQTSSPPALSPRRLPLGGRILLSHLLGAICYPLRLMQPTRVEPVSWTQRVGSLWLRLKWLLGMGRVQLLFIEQPVALRQIQAVAPFLREPLARPLAEYLREVLARRQGMHKKTYLHRFVIELGLMTLVASRYARARAASRAAALVDEHDVREGIGIAELLLTHQGEMGHSLVLDQLRLQLMSNPDDFIALLSAEI